MRTTVYAVCLPIFRNVILQHRMDEQFTSHLAVFLANRCNSVPDKTKDCPIKSSSLSVHTDNPSILPNIVRVLLVHWSN
jgi:hypothetical protein